MKTVPPTGTKIKPNRTVFLTITSFNSQLLTIPEIKYMPQQEAKLLLQSIGFKNIRTKIEYGAYENLVIGLETENGNKLNTGSNIPANSTLIIIISSNKKEEIFSMDSDSISDIYENSEEFSY